MGLNIHALHSTYAREPAIPSVIMGSAAFVFFYFYQSTFILYRKASFETCRARPFHLFAEAEGDPWLYALLGFVNILVAIGVYYSLRSMYN